MRGRLRWCAGLALVGAMVCVSRGAADEVDDLVKKLKAKDSEARLEACEGLGKLGAGAKSAVGGLIQLVNKETSTPVKRAAVVALGQIGPEAKAAASALVTVFKSDAAVRGDAGKALVQIGNDSAVSGLTRLLTADKNDKKADNALRAAAATTLGDFGPAAKGAVKGLKPLLADKDMPVKRAAIIALGKIGPDAKDAVPELIELLADKNAQIKLDTIDALGKIGGESKLAVRELGKLVNDPNAGVATKAIESLTKAGKSALPALVEGIKGKDVNRRLVVLRVLVENRVDATAALPELLALANDKNPQTKKLAQDLLGFLGKEAVPELVKLLKDKDQPDTTQKTVAAALSKAEVDKAHVPDLLGLLKDGRPEVRKAGADALAKTGADALDFLPELVAAMGDKDEAVRNAVGQAIYNTGRKGVAKLQEMLANEKQPAAKANVLAALGAMGPLAKGAFDDLAKYLNDPDEGVKKSATVALEKISKESVPALLKLLDSKEASVRVAAVLAVTEAGAQAKDTLPVLADLVVKDADAGVRRSALVALRTVGGMNLKDHAAKVGQALKDPDKDVRAQAALTLAEIGAAAEPAIPDLVAALADKETVVAKAAGEALGKLGGAAVNPLVEALKDPNPLTRRYATLALKEIGAKAKNALPMLIDALHDSDDATRQYAALALNELGPDAKAASIDLIYAMLRDKDKEVRNHAALALLRVNPEPSLAAPAFRQGLRDRKALGVTDCAVEGLTKLGPVAVPELRDALKDKDKVVRKLAAEVLGKLGAAAMPAVPALKEAAKDPDAAVKGAAEKALKEIGG